MMYVVGDSHTRSFSGNRNFTPFFLGAGKTICFVTQRSFEKIKLRLDEVAPLFPPKSQVLLVLGEPDSRFYLGKGWYPWDERGEDDFSNIDCKVHASLTRYGELLDYLVGEYDHQFSVLNLTYSERVGQNKYVKKINVGLQKLCHKKRIKFINIENMILKDNLEVKPGLMADVVHMSDKIQPFVEGKFDMTSQSGTPFLESEIALLQVQVGKKYIFDNKFKCFVRKKDNLFFERITKRVKWLKRLIVQIK